MGLCRASPVLTLEEDTMSSFTASAINPRKRGRLARSLYMLGFSLATVVLSAKVYAGCEYVVTNQWTDGFTASIKITNSGTSPINGWNVSWLFSGNNRVTSNWNAVYTGTNPYSASNLSWNGTIQPNQTVEIGFQGSKGTAAAEIPLLTGSACGTAASSAASSSVPASSVAASSIRSSVVSSSVRSSVVSSSVVSSSVPSSVASSSIRSSVMSSSIRASSVASSARSSSAASSSSTPNGNGVLYSESFENGTVGAAPIGWSTFIAWVFNGNNNSLSSGNYALIDGSKSYNGSNSIHFRGGQNPAQIVRALPAGTQRIHTRAYVNLSKVLGNSPGDNHEHIMGIKRTPDANDEVRVGQIKGVLGTNQVPSDNIAPKMAQWNSGPQLAPNTWYCIETAYYADTAYDELRMWVNGTLVHSITSASDWNNGALPADWLSDKLNYAMFGFHSFSGNTADVWMDDIVISTQAIGCGAIPSSSSSSVASSVPRSSSSVSSVVSSRSSVASSAVVSSSSIAMSSSSARSSVASSANSSVNPNAAWDLDTQTSYLNFVTTKNTHNVEVHSFAALNGAIGTNGVATVTIDLNSVNTGIVLRDQRIRDLLFETASYPTATITVTVPSTLLSSLAVGQVALTDVSATVDLHGLSVAVTTRVSVQRLSNSRILVQSIAPVLTRASDFNLTAGVETLRALVNLTSISAAVPVDFALVFNAR